MIVIGGERHWTIKDAAEYWFVSTKTVRDWIQRGVIPPPPKVKKGLREIQVFPDKFMKKADRAIDAWRKKRDSD